MASDVDVTPERMAIPYGVSFEGLLDVIGAWHRAQGYAKPMRTGEVGQQVRSGAKADSKAKLVSNQSSFLGQIGILRRVGQSNQLTDSGREVSRLVDQGLAEEFNSAMKRIVLTWPQARPLLEKLRHKGAVPRRELVQLIVEAAGKSMGTTNATMGANALIALFERLGLMRDEGGSLMISEEVTPGGEPSSPRTETAVTETPQPVEEAAPAEKHEEAVPLVTEPPRAVEETPPEEKHEEVAPVVIELPQPVEEPIAEEKHEETAPVVIELPQPVEEPITEEKHEEAVPVVFEPPQPVEETAPAEEHEEAETVMTEPAQPVGETAPAEEHEEAEPVVTKTPEPAEEAPPEEKHDDTEIVSESREPTERKPPTETHNEPEPVVTEPSHAAGEATPTEKHDDTEAARPMTHRKGHERWQYGYSGCCCCIFILLLILIVFPGLLSFLFP